MLKKMSSLVFILSLLWFSSASAATLNIEVEDLDLFPGSAWAFQFEFQLTGPWDFEAPPAAPGSDKDTPSLDWNQGVNGLLPPTGFGEISPYTKVDNLAPGFDNVTNTWNLNASMPNPSLIKILGDDQGMGLNPLKNGLLVTLIFPDHITLELSKSLFVSSFDLITPLPLLPSGLIFGEGDNTLTFSAVPIPSSLLLLGGGIFALLGINRRKK
ncbi:MAG: hypothetical protein GY699_01145 [Desulfobacteraceae bacterium]|nr:hypothetical protein [Desulfobacteraceae bacterium]